MSSAIGGAWQTLLGNIEGVGEELANTVTNLVQLPYTPTKGDGFEPHSSAQLHGADGVDDFTSFVRIRKQITPTWKVPAGQPLIASTSVNAVAGESAHVVFTANPSPANTWSDPDRASAVVGVFVDGKYQSDIEVPTERNEPYDINLGQLPPGKHTIELRAAIGEMPKDATGAQITDLHTYQSTGTQALIDRYEPILETRNIGPQPGVPSMAYNDAPLEVAAQVTHLDGGKTQIRYQYLFSNEDYGTPTPDLYALWGRTTDYEALFQVTLDAKNNPIAEQYEGPAHRHFAYTGVGKITDKVQTQRNYNAPSTGSRPVLRVSSGNNNASEHAEDNAPRWSQAAVNTPVDQSRTGADLMLNHPWTFKVAGEEIIRQHPGDTEADPRTKIFLGSQAMDPERDRLDLTGKLTLQLIGGKTATVTLNHDTSEKTDGLNDYEATTVPLPAGVTAGDIVGIVDEAPGSQAFVLDSNFVPRHLPNATNPLAAAVAASLPTSAVN